MKHCSAESSPLVALCWRIEIPSGLEVGIYYLIIVSGNRYLIDRFGAP